MLRLATSALEKHCVTEMEPVESPRGELHRRRLKERRSTSKPQQLRDHIPFMHNGCTFLRMRMIPPGGSAADLAGIKHNPSTGKLCVGHKHDAVSERYQAF